MSRRRHMRGARCLVTGASSGLGRALAVRLAAEGARVALTGRSLERLQETARSAEEAGANVDDLHILPADLTMDQERDRLLAAVAERFDGALDLAINAAGVGAYGRFESHEPFVLRRLIEVNLLALAEVCRGVLPLLRKGEAPALVNIGSIVARRGLPGRPEYSASKFAVAGLTESLRAEWTIEGIHVLLVNPGFTATSFDDNLVIDTAVYKTTHKRTMTPEAVALATLRALKRGRHEITLSAEGRLLLLVNRLCPRFVDWGFGRWASRLYSNTTALRRAEAAARHPADHS